MEYKFDCLALFSGGLDSILACKLMQAQGINVLGLHFTSPFFGHADKIQHWQEVYQLPLLPVDISQDYIDLFMRGPDWGIGKYLNPCVDCKILMLKKTQNMLAEFGANWIVSGEVLGQRPMSQRRDTLNLIPKEAGVKDVLLRPLCAKLMPPTPMENSGLVNREGLLDLAGRSRKRQLELADQFDIQEIPTPGGGCLLTDPQTSKRFFYVLRHLQAPGKNDFELSKIGRQFWYNSHWLVIGRNSQDNTHLLELVQPRDLVFKPAHIPGPIAIGRQLMQTWDNDIIEKAARFILKFTPKAKKEKEPVSFLIGNQDGNTEISISPDSEVPDIWEEPSEDTFQGEKKHFWNQQPREEDL